MNSKRQKHKTAEGTKRRKLKTAKAQNGKGHKTAEGIKRHKLKNGIRYTNIYRCIDVSDSNRMFFCILFIQKCNSY
jgi:hypothetical protein